MRTALPDRLGALAVVCALGLLLCMLASAPAQEDAVRLHVLFLGDKGHHKPGDRYRQLAPVLKKRGIDLTYTEKVSDLNDKTLAAYDGLLIYANIEKIAPEQEKALLDFVASGKGLIPLHCASYCFLNSEKYIALVGAQFRSHGTGIFRTVVADAEHPIMKGYSPFRSWDETYLHHKHNTRDRIVLEHRRDGATHEPWTWVRTHGKGRVFYTAWGHDDRTWGQPGFHNLVERGIRWACGGDPALAGSYVDGVPTMTKLPTGEPPFQYADAKVPFYPAGMRWGTNAKPLTKMQQPLPSKESMKRIIHPEGFELRLFADETLMGGKPICMAWDEKGRLWVCITRDYPNELQPPGLGRDRILILEDTDGDGVADKVTQFADNLSIPTSLAFANGGVVVHQAPQTLFFKDTNGDGKADERKVLFRGWTTNDTHAGPSNLQAGLDNWLYGMVGYAGFRGQVGEESHSFQQGFYRFKADGSKMEFLRNTNNNSWGVGFSEEGLLFGSTANGNPSVYLPIPNRYYEAVQGWSSSVLGGIAGPAKMHPITDKVRQVDHHGGFTAAAGHALYTARTYPQEYWNRAAFVTEPTGHLVATFQLQKNGTDFRSSNAWNLVASDDEWCAPVMAEVGPDGNVWVLDWYSYIVQHNPTPVGFKTGKGNAYETPLRDTKHGRIYRLVYTKAQATPNPDLSTTDGRVAALRNPNMFWRRHAQRLLVESGKADPRLVRSLTDLVENKTTDGIGLNPGAIHALWTLNGLGLMDGAKNALHESAFAAATLALKHPSAGVRRSACLVLPRTSRGAETLLAQKSLNDEEAHVQLAALLALSEMPADGKAGRAVAGLLANTEVMEDRWLPHAITSAAAAHAPSFLTEVAQHKDLSKGGRTLVGIVSRHYARGEVEKSLDGILAATAQSQPAVAETLLSGLATGWSDRSRKNAATVTLTDKTEKGLAELLPKLSSSGKASLLRFTAAIGNKAMQKYAGEVTRGLLETVRNTKVDDTERISSARQLLEMQPNDIKTVRELLGLIGVRMPPAVSVGLVEIVAGSSAKETGEEIVQRLEGWSPATRAAGLRALLSRSAATPALLGALEKGTVRMSELALDQKQVLAEHPDKAIRARATKLLAKGGDLPNPDRQKVIDKLMPLVKKSGDVERGKLVFKNQCAKCHTHSGEGANIGPDLTGMAVHPREELLVHIFDPNRSVEGNFRQYTVTTTNGQIISGMLGSETKTSIEIIDTEAKRTTIQRSKIEQLTGSSRSLMPEGFENQLKENEIVDLLEMLTAKGKYLPLPLDKIASIVSTKGMFYDENSTVERLVFPEWKARMFNDVPFLLIDPKGGKVNNVLLLYGPEGKYPPTMPKTASLNVNTPVKAVHLLSGVAGWAHPLGTKGSLTMTVRLHYKDDKTEDHKLLNGEHFADYIRRVDVPKSKFAFDLNGRQIRYLAIEPTRAETVTKLEFIKGTDRTAPVVMAVTIEPR